MNKNGKINYFKITFGIIIALSASRFIPHPPNFTSLLALSFYIPVFLGLRFVPALLFAFVVTDFFIGFHNLTLFTWGSVLIISFIAKYLKKNVYHRISGALLGGLVFFIFTNFGVWALGSYGYTFQGLVLCYILAIPFFTNTIVSTLIFSIIIEALYKTTIMYFPKTENLTK